MNQHHPRKRFGQHFLTDESVVSHIISVITPSPEQHLVEIGPGLGALTKKLLPLCKIMDAIELDRDLIEPLRNQCMSLGKIIIHQADALRFDFSTLYQNNKPLRIVGNLPYNISTPLLFHLIKFAKITDNLHFMLQKEVVDRMVAGCDDEDYGRLTVMIQYHYNVEKLFFVGREAFTPPPRVDSAIVRLTPYKKLPFLAQNYLLFEDIVRQAFTQRRKTLRNALKNFISGDELFALNIDPVLRPECITIEKFVAISNFLNKGKHGNLCDR